MANLQLVGRDMTRHGLSHELVDKMYLLQQKQKTVVPCVARDIIYVCIVVELALLDWPPGRK